MVQLGITLKNAVGTTNAYSQDVEDALVQFFTSSGLGRQLLHSIYTQVNPGADKQRLNQLVRWHSDAQCSPEQAVALLLDLGIVLAISNSWSSASSFTAAGSIRRFTLCKCGRKVLRRSFFEIRKGQAMVFGHDLLQ